VPRAPGGRGIGDWRARKCEPVGVLARLMLELFRYDVTLDPARPPVLRTDTLAERYETFPVIVHVARS
jgi:hypothetical protein